MRARWASTKPMVPSWRVTPMRVLMAPLNPPGPPMRAPMFKDPVRIRLRSWTPRPTTHIPHRIGPPRASGWMRESTRVRTHSMRTPGQSPPPTRLPHPTGRTGPNDAETDVAIDAMSVDGAPSGPVTCDSAPAVSATLHLLGSLPQVTSCGYSAADAPAFYAAVDPETFAASAACGVCLRIQTPAGMVAAMMVDLGPNRTAANLTAIALNRDALQILAPDGATLVEQGVEWRRIPCEVATRGMTFTFQVGSNPSYAAVLIRNHRHGLAKVEYKSGGGYKELERTSYNYWLAPTGMGAGPFTFRVTDVLGQSVEETGIPLIPGQIFQGVTQFAPCVVN